MDNVGVNVNIPLQSKSVTYSEAGDYQVTPDPGYEALSKVDVKVSLEGKTQIPNGFRFTGGDMSLVEWDKYDWSMVYNTTNFFNGCSSSDPNWFDRFKYGFNGKLLSGYNMFGGFNSNQQIDFTGIDTSEMIDGRYMFLGSKFTNIKGLNALNIIDALGMFQNCKSLESIDIINTHNVTSMSYMFNYCLLLQSIPQLDTSNVTIMQNMFEHCQSIQSIPQLDTSKVTSMSNMFGYCTLLQSIPQLDTSKVTNMENMFNSCKSLQSIPQLDTSKVTNMREMFYYCESLQSIPQLDTSKVVNMWNTFRGCKSLRSIPQLDISKVTNMNYTFYNCVNLIELKFKGKPTASLSVSGTFDLVETNGVLYYDSRYDYSKIIGVLPSTWTAVPYDVIN